MNISDRERWAAIYGASIAMQYHRCRERGNAMTKTKDEVREIVKKIFGMSPEMGVRGGDSMYKEDPEPYSITIPYRLDVSYHNNVLEGRGAYWEEALNDLLSNIDSRMSFYDGKIQEAEKEKQEYGKARSFLLFAKQRRDEAVYVGEPAPAEAPGDSKGEL